MIRNNSSTLNVNEQYLVLLSPPALTFQVNKTMNNNPKVEFGKWLKPLIETLKPKYSQADVAKKAGITPTHLSRIVTGESGLKRDTANSVIDAINELAGNDIADKKFGLRFAGFSEIGIEPSAIEELAQKLAAGVMASGFDRLKDQDLIDDYMDDMRTIAESMLKRKLEEQEKRNKK